jgi:glycosyltransferase involved in cell wall biosynthesis
MTSVAICIPTYNQAPYLEGAVRSALAQMYPCEIWVSDDASTDETPSVMARLLKDFPQIRYVRHEKNLGMSENSRWIVQQPITDYVVKLDSDDELDPGYVKSLSEALIAHPLAGYAHTAVREIDGNGCTQKLRLLARNAGFQVGDESLRASVSGYRVAANVCMFRRAALQQVNYYRSASGYVCDWDLAVRLADAGWGNVYVSEVLAGYRVWDTSDKVRSRRKMAELEGYCRLIEDSLLPAFTRRKWSLAPITKTRRQLALGHATCLRSAQFSNAERSDLKHALCELGDSKALRWKFRWIRTPLAPLFELPGIVKAHGRAWVKKSLFMRMKNQ